MKPNTHAMPRQAQKLVKVKVPHSSIGCQMKCLATTWEGGGSNRSLCDPREKARLLEIVVPEPVTMITPGLFFPDPLMERNLRRLGNHLTIAQGSSLLTGKNLSRLRQLMPHQMRLEEWNFQR